jgi:hypothetical protein
MKRRTRSFSLALITLAVLGLTRPGTAQQPSLDLVPFKATLAGHIGAQDLFIPLNPPIVSQNFIETGQADFLGQVTSAEHFITHLDAAGARPLAITDGVGVFMAANGDAIFVSFSGLTRPPAAGEFGEGEFAFTVTGGRGRFAGANGSGVMHDVVKGSPGNAEVARTFEGMITRPKP